MWPNINLKTQLCGISQYTGVKLQNQKRKKVSSSHQVSFDWPLLAFFDETKKTAERQLFLEGGDNYPEKAL